MKKFTTLYQELNVRELSKISSSIIDRTQSERSHSLGKESGIAKLESVKKIGGKVWVSFTTPATKGDKIYAMTVLFKDADKLDSSNFYKKDVKVNCTCPHYHWGGIKYDLSNLSSSIRKTDIANSYWGDKHGKATVCKHLKGLLINFSDYKNEIIKELNQIK